MILKLLCKITLLYPMKITIKLFAGFWQVFQQYVLTPYLNSIYKCIDVNLHRKTTILGVKPLLKKRLIFS